MSSQEQQTVFNQVESTRAELRFFDKHEISTEVHAQVWVFWITTNYRVMALHIISAYNALKRSVH